MSTETNSTTNREYKDRLFKFIFGNPTTTRGAYGKRAILRCFIWNADFEKGRYFFIFVHIEKIYHNVHSNFMNIHFIRLTKVNKVNIIIL